jgi:DNA-directed RNA polymerase III subunit RPC3
VVLIQHHFALHYTDSRTGRTYFEANGETAYNIVFRYGKLAKIVEDRLGSDAAELLMTVVLLGHGRVSDIVRELQRQPEEVDKNAKLHAEDQDDETVPNGATAVNSDIPLKPSFGSNSKIDSIPQVHNLLDSLLCAGFLKKVTEHQFMPDCDREEEARQVVLENSFPTGLKGNKEKAKCLNDVNDLKRSWRDMEHDHAQGPWKRLKMNGRHTNGVSEDLGTAQLDIVDDGVTIDVSQYVLVSR